MLKIITGFIILFSLYHGAEYMIMKENSVQGFLALQAVFFFMAWLLARWQGFKGYSAWGMVFETNALKNLLAGLLVGGFVYGLYFFTSLCFHFEEITSIPPPAKFLPAFLLFTFGTFFSSLSEDVLTRSYIFRHGSGKIPDGILLLFSSALYVANHIYRLGDGYLVLLYLFVIGIFLMLALMITKNIWLTLGLHWSGNILYQVTQQIIQTQSHGSAAARLWLYIGFLLLLVPVTYILARFLRQTKTGS